MKKIIKIMALLCAVFVLLGLCACSDRGDNANIGDAEEKQPVRDSESWEKPEKLSTNFDTRRSEHMSDFMSGGRAAVQDNMVYGLEFDENYAPVLAGYEVLDGGLSRFKILAEGCVPEYLTYYEGRLYYINGSSFKVESISADGSDRRVLLDEPADCLQIVDGLMYFCDASGRFCRAELDGSGKTMLIDDACFYAYCFDGMVLYQSGNDGESLHLRKLEDGSDIKLTDTVSYAPVIIENTLYYTQGTNDGNRVCGVDLSSGIVQVYETPIIKGAAEFVYDAEKGWLARFVPIDERLEQSLIPVAELGEYEGDPCGYSGYRLCDHAGGGIRIDAEYENGGRLRCFVLTLPDGREIKYISGQVQQH